MPGSVKGGSAVEGCNGSRLSGNGHAVGPSSNSSSAIILSWIRKVNHPPLTVSLGLLKVFLASVALVS